MQTDPESGSFDENTCAWGTLYDLTGTDSMARVESSRRQENGNAMDC
jgi:hypothetical protein